jgi:prophage regulatory protein
VQNSAVIAEEWMETIDRRLGQQRVVAALDDRRLIRLKEVLAICGISRSTVYAAIKKGQFPAPIKVGERSTAWIKGEVMEWVDQCIRATREQQRSL